MMPVHKCPEEKTKMREKTTWVKTKSKDKNK